MGNKNKFLFLIDSFLYLKTIKPTVIQCFGGWYCLLPAVIYKKIYPCKIIGAFHTEPEKKLSLIGKSVMQGLINECDCITFGSKKLVQKMEEIEGLKFRQIEITPAGIRSFSVPENKIQEFKNNFKIRLCF
jgi:hypothetical protein